jgi:formamidopyrimidine-DNA glycosylase
MSKIHPLKSCNNLNKNDLSGLILNIKKILKFSISKGGSSIRDFRNIIDKKGEFQPFFHVYGRKNKNCSRISCKGKIKKIVISNRATFYCHLCQI